MGERRHLPRYKTRRPARIFDAAAGPAGGTRPLLPMVGYTHDISETGLAVVLTSDTPGGPQDELVGRELRIVLDLPAGLAELRGLVVRGQPVKVEDGGRGYLIGVRITWMGNHDWAEMIRYILDLRKRA